MQQAAFRLKRFPKLVSLGSESGGDVFCANVLREPDEGLLVTEWGDQGVDLGGLDLEDGVEGPADLGLGGGSPDDEDDCVLGLDLSVDGLGADWEPQDPEGVVELVVRDGLPLILGSLRGDEGLWVDELATAGSDLVDALLGAVGEGAGLSDELGN